MSRTFLEELKEEMKQKYIGMRWSGSFSEFLSIVEKNPKMHTRSAFQYISDMIQSFGSYKIHDCGDELTRYRIFDDPFDNGEHAVFGLNRTLMRLVANLRTIAERGGSERIILLHGPVATAKTTIARLLIKGMEEYTTAPEGGMYTFNWMFPKEISIKDLGFRLDGIEKIADESYAHLSEEEVLGSIPCQLNDSPLLLIPKKERKAHLEKIIAASGQEFNIPHKILEGELCFNCQSIYNHLLKKYKNDMSMLLRHIQVERVFVSEVNKIAAATVQPVQNLEGHAPIILWESSNYANVANLLKSLKIHQFEGKWADANRGIIHLTDIFKKKGEYLQYLLSAVAEHIVDFNGVQGFIDAVIIGTTNIDEYANFQAQEMNAGLEDRIRCANIGYILQPKEEAKIYQKQLREAGYKPVKEKETDAHIFPHAMEILALWSVMTRLKKPDAHVYRDAGFSRDKQAIIEDLQPIVKARLYDGEIHDALELKDRQMLKDKAMQKLLRNEHVRNELYDEGMSGISPRRVQNMITDMLSKKEMEEARAGKGRHCLSIFRVMKAIDEIVREGKEPCFKHDKDKSPYTDAEEQIEMLWKEYRWIVSKEIKRSIIGLTEGAVDAMIKDYIDNVCAYERKLTVRNRITGRDEQPSEEKMKWFEEKLGIKEEAKDEHRKKMLQDIALEHDHTVPLDAGSMSDINKGIYDTFIDGLFNEQKKAFGLNLDQFKAAIEKYGTPKFDELSKDEKDIVTRAFDNMIGKYNYCAGCAKDVLLYSISDGVIKFRED